jgi:hypothetical protein
VILHRVATGVPPENERDECKRRKEEHEKRGFRESGGHLRQSTTKAGLKEICRMSKIPVAAAVFLASFVSDRVVAEGLGSEWTYQYVLSTSDRGADLTHIAASYPHQAWLREPAMLDLLAETLLRGARRPDYSQPELVIMAKVVCRASPRYFATMNAVSRSISYVEGFRREEREYREALKEIAGKCVEETDSNGARQYSPGTIDLDAMRSRFLAQNVDVKPTSAQGQKLLKIGVGEEGEFFDDVIGSLGTPQHVDIGTAVLAQGGGIRAGGIRWATRTYVKYRHTNRLHYYYRGVGRVTFTYRNSGWRASEVIADPMLFERELPYRADPAANGQPDEMTLRMHELLYGGYRSARQAVEAYAPVSFTPEVKDTVAEFLASRYAPERGKIIDDTFIVLARFLARSDAVRYGALIKEIAAGSDDRRMRKVAESIVLEGADPTRLYRPGDVLLEELRRKYPPLYPESTLIGPEADTQDSDDVAAD